MKFPIRMIDPQNEDPVDIGLYEFVANHGEWATIERLLEGESSVMHNDAEVSVLDFAELQRQVAQYEDDARMDAELDRYRHGN